MKTAGFMILLAAAAAPADRGGSGLGLMSLDAPIQFGPGTDALFQYDDGTAAWVTWGGLYRGTWFNAEDFNPEATGCLLDASEFWFYEGDWDTPFFFAEVYSGGSGGPATLIDQTSVCASHYCQVLVDYDPPLAVPSNFWVVENTEMSEGGWPSLMGDGTGQPSVSHSFLSDDFLVWEPWVIDQPNACDFFIRGHGVPVFESLEQATWGTIKTLF